LLLWHAAIPDMSFLLVCCWPVHKYQVCWLSKLTFEIHDLMVV